MMSCAGVLLAASSSQARSDGAEAMLEGVR